MLKQEFLNALRAGLSGLPQADIEERATFYGEMIDDRMEEGVPEEEAVAAVGPVDEIVSQIVAETPLTRIVKERVKPKRRLKAGEIVLLVLGSPIWLSLLIAAFAVVFSLYVVLWALLVCLWAVFAAFVVCALACVAAGISFAVQGYGLSGLAVLAAGLVLAGLAIFLFFACKAASKGVVKLTAKIARGIKKCFMKKEEA
ncbi:MAG: DUF1700 domain-containing protein [Clostridia bacterium]|nr:DUF1700 domain-containing protein [Clostridia bacterium]